MPQGEQGPADSDEGHSSPEHQGGHFRNMERHGLAALFKPEVERMARDKQELDPGPPDKPVGYVSERGIFFEKADEVVARKSQNHHADDRPRDHDPHFAGMPH